MRPCTVFRCSLVCVQQAGQTPLSIAQRLGYLSVVETLHQITEVIVAPSAMTGRYKPVSPETMQEVTLFEMEETSKCLQMAVFSDFVRNFVISKCILYGACTRERLTKVLLKKLHIIIILFNHGLVLTMIEKNYHYYIKIYN